MKSKGSPDSLCCSFRFCNSAFAISLSFSALSFASNAFNSSSVITAIRRVAAEGLIIASASWSMIIAVMPASLMTLFRSSETRGLSKSSSSSSESISGVVTTSLVISLSDIDKGVVTPQRSRKRFFSSVFTSATDLVGAKNLVAGSVLGSAWCERRGRGGTGGRTKVLFPGVITDCCCC